MTRLERAKQLPVVRIGPRQYFVGSTQYVDLNGMDPCHCEDAIWRSPVICKHVLACLLHEGVALSDD